MTPRRVLRRVDGAVGPAGHDGLGILHLSDPQFGAHVDPDRHVGVPTGSRRGRHGRRPAVGLPARRLPVARDATCVAWSPDGAQLAVGHWSGWVTVYVLAQGPRTGGSEVGVALEEVEEVVSFIAAEDGWAAVFPDGRYGIEGDVGEAFWWSAGLCRFEPGEIDGYQGIRRVTSELPVEPSPDPGYP